jgi:hypothetical protein
MCVVLGLEEEEEEGGDRWWKPDDDELEGVLLLLVWVVAVRRGAEVLPILLVLVVVVLVVGLALVVPGLVERRTCRTKDPVLMAVDLVFVLAVWLWVPVLGGVCVCVCWCVRVSGNLLLLCPKDTRATTTCVCCWVAVGGMPNKYSQTTPGTFFAASWPCRRRCLWSAVCVLCVCVYVKGSN